MEVHAWSRQFTWRLWVLTADFEGGGKAGRKAGGKCTRGREEGRQEGSAHVEPAVHLMLQTVQHLVQ